MNQNDLQPVDVLLAEDSPSDAALLRESLTQNDLGLFQFTEVETLKDTLDWLGRRRFDVLVLDLSLPDARGPETYIKARTAAPRLPIVILTGVEDELVGVEAVRGGVQDYLIKGQAYGRQTARAIRFAIERQRAGAAMLEERGRLEARMRERAAELDAAKQALAQELSLRRRAEEAHQEALRRLREAEDMERCRLSRQLQDLLGQKLGVLKNELGRLRMQAPDGSSQWEAVSQLETLAAGLLPQLHRLPGTHGAGLAAMGKPEPGQHPAAMNRAGIRSL